jgi:hypothetical protein
MAAPINIFVMLMVYIYFVDVLSNISKLMVILGLQSNDNLPDLSDTGLMHPMIKNRLARSKIT